MALALVAVGHRNLPGHIAHEVAHAEGPVLRGEFFPARRPRAAQTARWFVTHHAEQFHAEGQSCSDSRRLGFIY